MSARLVPETTDLINYADPDESGTRMVMAQDLMQDMVSRDGLEAALHNLDEVLADDTISTADLKGPLNRASAKSWGGEYSRTFTPRQFLEELRGAIQRHLDGN